MTACGGENGDSKSNSKSESNSSLLSKDLISNSFVKDAKKLSKDFYGKWRYIDTGKEVLILSNSKLDYEIKNKDLLLIKDSSGERRYLMRAGVSTAKIKGKILLSSNQNTKSLKSNQDLKTIEVTLQNTLDDNLKSKTSTNENGEFEDSSQPSGTTVKLTATDGNKTFETAINVDSAEVDIGNFVLRDANNYNFKSTIISNEEFIYADGKPKKLTLNIKNIGNVEGTDIWYKIYYKKKENIKKACESANSLEKDENKIWSYATLKTED